jgi:hypothetical protein
MRKRVMALLLCALVLFSVATVLRLGFSYYWNPYNPGRWRYYSTALKVFDPSSYRQHTVDSATSWNIQPIKPKFDMAGLPAAHDIGCVKSNYGATGWSGLAAPQFWFGYITHVDLKWNSYYMDGYDVNKRCSTCAHELGHSLGLYDSGTDPVLMNGYDSSRYDWYGIFTPQADDVAGINDHYP